MDAKMEQKNKFLPFEIRDIDRETNALLFEHFEDDEMDYVQVGTKGYFMHKLYEKHAAVFYNLQPRADQVFVGGLPRSGTTWTQQLIWLIKNNLDYAACDATSMNDKFAFLEPSAVHPNKIFKHAEKIPNDAMKQMIISYYTRPIFEIFEEFSYFKTHLPLSLLPPKLLDSSKMVYIARDPRDTAVSLYYFMKGGYLSFKKDFKTFWKRYIEGMMTYCPYFEHVKEAWEKRNHTNLLFLFYEDIQNDQLNTLRRVADFFGKSYTDEQLLGLGSYLHFNNLKDKKTYNYYFLKDLGMMKSDAEPFIRKGIVGEWREHFDEEMSREAELWIADNLRGTDLRLPTFTDDQLALV